MDTTISAISWDQFTTCYHQYYLQHNHDYYYYYSYQLQSVGWYSQYFEQRCPTLNSLRERSISYDRLPIVVWCTLPHQSFRLLLLISSLVAHSGKSTFLSCCLLIIHFGANGIPVIIRRQKNTVQNCVPHWIPDWFGFSGSGATIWLLFVFLWFLI